VKFCPKSDSFLLQQTDTPLKPTWLVEAVNYVSLPTTQSSQAQGKGTPAQPQTQSGGQALSQGLQVVEDVKALLKGLVDLQRVESAY
jgi:hypothetical protein